MEKQLFEILGREFRAFAGQVVENHDRPLLAKPEEVVRILDGSNQSLRQNGVSVSLVPSRAINGAKVHAVAEPNLVTA